MGVAWKARASSQESGGVQVGGGKLGRLQWTRYERRE
jgi:hypothetical protein